MSSALPLRIYVAYHDSRPHPLLGQEPYVALCNTGPDGVRPVGFDLYDDRGWPAKNHRYCELSAQRQLEQDAAAEYLGLVHYRRVFVTKASPRRFAPQSYILSRWDWADPGRHGATGQELMTRLDGRDWCTTPAYDIRWSGNSSLWDHFCQHHPEAFLEVLVEVMQEMHPGLPDFRHWLRVSVRMPFFNMFIARREWVREYGNWLWPVLQQCEDRIGEPADPYQRRYVGFLAERLHAYWLECVAVPGGATTGVLPVAVLEPQGIVNTRSSGVVDVLNNSANTRMSPSTSVRTLLSTGVQTVPWPLRVAVNRASRKAAQLAQGRHFELRRMR